MTFSPLHLVLLLAAALAVPELLVRGPDQQVAFQAMLVLQLLGVIVAAIGVAAAFSTLGLAAVQFLSRPWQRRADTFVAWSFLRVSHTVLPMPLRLQRGLQTLVRAEPEQAADPKLAAQAQPKKLLQGAAMVGLGAAVVAVAVPEGVELRWLALRNLGAALALAGLVHLLAGLPRRGLRSALAQGLVIAALVAGAAAARHPQILPWVDPLPLVAAALMGLMLGLFRPGSAVGMAGRLARRGRWTVLPALALLGASVAARVALGPQPWIVAGVSALAALALVALYLLLQGQAKVTVPVFVSIVGVAAGTWALIVVLSVMGGFAADLRGKMLVANAHALVEAPGRAAPFARAAALAAALRQLPGVAAVSPQVRGDAILSSSFNVNNFVAVRGIDPSLAEVQRELAPTMRTGDLALLSDPAALGSDRALQRRSDDAPSDVPLMADITPSAGEPAAKGAEDADALLKALGQLPPGPSEPAVPGSANSQKPHAVGEVLGRSPQPNPRDSADAPVLLLPSDGKAVAPSSGRAPRVSPPAEALPLGESVDLGTHDAADDARRQPRAPDGPGKAGKPGLWSLLDDPPTASPESTDVPVIPGILLGVELAHTLQVELGDKIEVVTPDGDVGPTGLRPRVRSFRVAGTFETGLYEADSKVAYVTLEEGARYFNLAGQANVLELRLTEPETPDAVLAQVRSALAQGGAGTLEVVDWRQLNRSLFSALAFERLVIFLVLGLIILVAAFAIVSALTMVILQKHDSIAMLRAMGAAAKEVRSAFVQMGGVIGLIGTSAGATLGLGTCLLIQTLGIQLPEAYYVRTLPVRLQVSEIAIVIVASLAVSLIATVIPARSAGRLEPLEGLRHG